MTIVDYVFCLVEVHLISVALALYLGEWMGRRHSDRFITLAALAHPNDPPSAAQYSGDSCPEPSLRQLLRGPVAAYRYAYSSGGWYAANRYFWKQVKPEPATRSTTYVPR